MRIKEFKYDKSSLSNSKIYFSFIDDDKSAFAEIFNFEYIMIEGREVNSEYLFAYGALRRPLLRS